jgi:hypothetical protein
VAESIDAFRQGLMALVPSAQRVGLTWEDENTHDDWERLAETLFEVLVASPIRQDLRRGPDAYPLPRYDYDFMSYVEMSWLEVILPDGSRTLVFVRLLSRAGPFDTVQLAPSTRDGLVSGERAPFSYGDVSLHLRRRFVDGGSEIVNKLFLDE